MQLTSTFAVLYFIGNSISLQGPPLKFKLPSTQFLYHNKIAKPLTEM